MVIKQLFADTIAKLKELGIDDYQNQATILILYVLNIAKSDLIIKSDFAVTEDNINLVDNCIKKLKNNYPIQYITGIQEFMSLEFKVNENVLIPRQDTETLVEKILENYDKNQTLSILDIGTGSGAIAISLAYYLPKATVAALDISKSALEIVKINAEKNGVADRIKFINADILNCEIKEKFDVVVSNPPYIETEVIKGLDNNVKDFEPYNALDGGEDGLVFYRHISKIAPNILNKKGMIFFEIGYNQGKNVPQLMSNNFKSIKVFKDYCGNDRVVMAQREQ